MPVKQLPGHWFQDLVAALERHFADRPKVTVHSPLRLRDYHTKRMREHDVVLSQPDHHGTLLTAIECKDRSRKVGVPDIEAFSRKLEATGVHRGFIVSSSGFHDTARAKAAFYNIGCVDLSEVENLDWVEARQTEAQYVAHFPYIGIKVECGGRPAAEPCAFFDGDGAPLTRGKVEAIARSVLTEDAMRASSDPDQRQAIRVEGTGIYAIDADGNVHAPAEILIEYQLSVEKFQLEWRLHRYGSQASKFEMVSTEFTLAGLDARFLVIREEDGKNFRIGLSKKISNPIAAKRRS